MQTKYEPNSEDWPDDDAEVYRQTFGKPKKGRWLGYGSGGSLARSSQSSAGSSSGSFGTYGDSSSSVMQSQMDTMQQRFESLESSQITSQILEERDKKMMDRFEEINMKRDEDMKLFILRQQNNLTRHLQSAVANEFETRVRAEVIRYVKPAYRPSPSCAQHPDQSTQRPQQFAPPPPQQQFVPPLLHPQHPQQTPPPLQQQFAPPPEQSQERVGAQEEQEFDRRSSQRKKGKGKKVT